MIINSRKPGSALRQKGAAFIMLMVTILGSLALVMLQGSASGYLRESRDRQLTNALAAAKEALIAFAVNYADNYGHNTRGGTGRLPCPALSRFSSPHWTCGENAIGFLPAIWDRDGKLMDIDHVERFLKQDLWYAVASDFRFNPSSNRLNPDAVTSLLAVDELDNIAAVIIAPGTPQPDQDRLLSPALVRSYLEGENADLDGHFSRFAGNDRLIVISASELMPLIERRVLGYAREWLSEYKSVYGYYPYAAPFDDPLAACESGLTRGKLALNPGNCADLPFGEFVSSLVPKARPLNNTWFANSQWPAFIYYQFSEHCAVMSASGSCGETLGGKSELTVNGEPVQALLINSGPAIETAAFGGMQQRIEGSSGKAAYFDTVEVLEAETDFTIPGPVTGVSNDQFLVIPW